MDVREKLINANDLLNAIRDDYNINGAHFSRIRRHIEDAPAVDAVEVVHGRWLCVDTDTEHFFLCNRCKKKEFLQSNYCRSCGAKMDLGG